MLKQYLDSLRGRRVAVLGIGVSNTPLIELLASEGISVTACDKKEREQLGRQAEQLERLGVKLRLGSGYLDGLSADIIFRTPGLRPDIPALERARAAGAEITSEMEKFFDLCPCPIVAVTGSDGKTTTTSMIAEMLRAAGRRTWLGGNIGNPLLCSLPEMTPEDICVVELSSFQLMTMRRAAAVAVVTNVSPNHLDIHRDMDEYIAAKRNVFLAQQPEDRVVLNMDNEITRGFAADAASHVRFFSAHSRPQDGVYLEDGVIYDNGERILAASELRVLGAHNAENFMAACCALRELVPRETMAEVGRSFPGVEHRLEFVRELGGVKYYNDSIGTSPNRTMAGLSCFDSPLVLIAGGYDKHIPFDELGEEIAKKVRLLLLCGATADKIEAAVAAAPSYAAGKPEMRIFSELSEAVRAARELARAGDTVLFSPACASFDQFPNFSARGKFFKDQVNKLV